MIGLGYSDSEHRHGWDLYLKMLGYMGATAKAAPTSTQLRRRISWAL